MTYNTITDVTFRGARYSSVVAKLEDSHSTARADKQMNKDTLNRLRYFLITPNGIRWFAFRNELQFIESQLARGRN